MATHSADDRAIFEIARKMPAEKRDAYLQDVGREQPEVESRVRALLVAYEENASFLEVPAVEFPATLLSPSLEESSTIGPYKLLQEIGEGGMGVVYLAEQQEPVKRKVALKVIKPGMDSRQIIARFEAERQALAIMDHPHIAKVFDAGTTQHGQPFFVMELVKGMPITQYCDEKRLTLRERLKLFVPVCQAIQHAHQKGVIHRDIKPSNVLVAEYDEQPVAKVIDFGVAKAVGAQLSEKTMFTALGQLVGTLEYMSPEQAKLNQLDIDTRSDIYSLGVLLYELLTGSTPFDRRTLEQSAFDEILRIIREQEPPRPSLKLSSSDTLPSVAANRNIEPARLNRTVRGELDWIVMRCLEKDRSRRYETANGLAQDIERYLCDEPVEACPPSKIYRLRKFARKNKSVLATAAAFVLVLILSAVVSLGQAARAWVAEKEANRQRDDAAAARDAERNQREQAEIDRDQALKAKQRAEIAEVEARTEAAISAAVNQFLQDDLLGQADAEFQANLGLQPDRELTVRQALDRASEAIGDRFQDQPAVEASLRHTIGNCYRALGDFEKAETHLQRALELRRKHLGVDDEQTLSTMNALGYAYALQHGTRNGIKSEPLLAEALKRCQRVLGREHPLTLTVMHNLAIAAASTPGLWDIESLNLQVLEARRRVLGEAHPETLRTMSNLSITYQAQRKYQRAEGIAKRLLQLRREQLGNEHPMTLQIASQVGGLYVKLGRRAEGKHLLEEAYQGQRRILGPRHPWTHFARHSLLTLYMDAGQYDEAEPLAIEVRAIALEMGQEKLLASKLWAMLIDRHLHTIFSERGTLELVPKGKYADAVPILQDFAKGVYGRDALFQAQAKSLLGECLAKQGKYAESEPMLLESYGYLKEHEADLPPAQRRRVTQALARVAQLYEAWEHTERAAEWKEKLREEEERTAKRDRAIIAYERGLSLVAQKKQTQAEVAFREAIDSDPTLPEAYSGLGELLCYGMKDPRSAIEPLREAVRLRPDDPSSRCLLGNALIRCGQPDEAHAEFRLAFANDDSVLWHLIHRRRKLAEIWRCQDAVRKNPDDAEAHFQLGLANQGYDFEAAKRELFEAIRLNPKHSQACLEAASLGSVLEDHAEHERLLREALKADPENKRAQELLAVALERAGRHTEAEQQFRAILRKHPHDNGALNGLDRQLLRRGQGGGVEVDLREAIAAAPKNAGLHLSLGVFLSSKGERHGQAEESLREAIRLAERPAVAHFQLANLLRQMRRLGESEAAFRVAIDLEPDHADWHVARAEVLLTQERWEQAEDAFRQTIRRFDGDGLSGLLTALEHQGKLDEAEEVCRSEMARPADNLYVINKFLRRHGKPPLAKDPPAEEPRFAKADSAAYSGRVPALEYQKELAQAEAAARVAIHLDPGNAEAHYMLGELLARSRDDLESGILSLREAVRSNPKHERAWTSLGYALWRQGKLEEAEHAYRQSVLLSDDEARARKNLAILLRAQGKLAEAATELKRVVELAPEDAEIWRDLADLLLQARDPALRDPERALELATRAIEASPKDVWGWKTLGWAQYRLGDWRAAIESLEKSCELQGNPEKGDAIQWLYLAMANWQLGHHDKASEWYQRGLDWTDEHKGKNAVAVELLFEATGLLEKPVPAWARKAQSRFLVLDKQWDDVAKIYQRAIESTEEDRRGYSERSKVYQELSQWDQVFERIAESRPDDVELRINRGRSLVRKSEFQKAKDAYSEGIKDYPIAEACVEYACVLLLTGDQEGYRRYCLDLIERLSKSSTLQERYVVLKVCALSENPAVPPARLIEWGEKIIRAQSLPWHHHALSLAYYRGGKPELAIEQALKSQESPRWDDYRNIQNLLVLAMAYQATNQKKESQVSFSEANKRWAKPESKWIGDAYVLTCRVLLREAEAGLGQQPESPETQKASK